jgi:hypothetical protein
MARLLVATHTTDLPDFHLRRILFWINSWRDVGHEIHLLDDQGSPLADLLPRGVTHLRTWGRQPLFNLWQLLPRLAGPLSIEFDAIVLVVARDEKPWGALFQVAQMARGRDWRGRPTVVLELQETSSPSGYARFSDIPATSRAVIKSQSRDSSAAQRTAVFWADGKECPWLDTAATLLDRDPNAVVVLAGQGHNLRRSDWLLTRDRLDHVGHGRWRWSATQPDVALASEADSVWLAGGSLSRQQLRLWIMSAHQSDVPCFIDGQQARALKGWGQGSWSLVPTSPASWHQMLSQSISSAPKHPKDPVPGWQGDNCANDFNRLLNLHLRLGT